MPALSLIEVLAQVPDPRSRHGRVHPLPAIRALTSWPGYAAARARWPSPSSAATTAPPGPRPRLHQGQDPGRLWPVRAIPPPRRGRLRGRPGAPDPVANAAGGCPRGRRSGPAPGARLDRRQGLARQQRRHATRTAPGRCLRPAGRSRPGPGEGRCQDRRAQGRPAAVGPAAGPGPPRHRRRPVRPARRPRGHRGAGRRLPVLRQGQPARAANRPRGRLRLRGGRPGGGGRLLPPTARRRRPRRSGRRAAWPRGTAGGRSRRCGRPVSGRRTASGRGWRRAWS